MLAAARRGDDGAWSRVYRDLSGSVLGYLRSQRAPSPEDVTGEVFVQVVRDLDGFDGDEAGFRAWVFTIVHRRLLDARRYERRHPEDTTDERAIEPRLPVSRSEPDALEQLSTDEIIARLDELTDDQREVLLLRLVGGLYTGEVAEVTGRTRSAVKALSKRGLERLRRRLRAQSTSDSDAAELPPPQPASRRSRG